MLWMKYYSTKISSFSFCYNIVKEWPVKEDDIWNKKIHDIGDDNQGLYDNIGDNDDHGIDDFEDEQKYNISNFHESMMDRFLINRLVGKGSKLVPKRSARIK